MNPVDYKCREHSCSVLLILHGTIITMTILFDLVLLSLEKLSLETDQFLISWLLQKPAD